MVKIGLCGIMASGKTTLAEQLIQNYSDFTRCSLAGAVKEFANFIFDIPEGFKDRVAYQKMGDGARNYLFQDVWIETLLQQVAGQEGFNKHFVVDDIRYENEVDKLKFNSSEEKHELSALYEEKIKNIKKINNEICGDIIVKSCKLKQSNFFLIMSIVIPSFSANFLQHQSKFGCDLISFQVILGLVDNTLGPFLSPSMVTENVLDIVQGKIPDDPDVGDFVKNAFLKGVDPFVPGFVPFFERYNDYDKTGVTSSFSTIAPGDVDAFAFAGLSRKRQDLTAGARFNFTPAFNEINSASKYTTRLLKDPNENDPTKIFDGFKDTQKQRLNGFKDLRNLIQIYNDLGMNTTDIINALSVNDLLNVQAKDVNLLDAANDNYYIPYFPNLADDKIGYSFSKQLPEIFSP